MIGSIKIAWLRRSIIVLLTPVAFVVHVALGIYDGVISACNDIRDGWSGL